MRWAPQSRWCTTREQLASCGKTDVVSICGRLQRVVKLPAPSEWIFAELADESGLLAKVVAVNGSVLAQELESLQQRGWDAASPPRVLITRLTGITLLKKKSTYMLKGSADSALGQVPGDIPAAALVAPMQQQPQPQQRTATPTRAGHPDRKPDVKPDFQQLQSLRPAPAMPSRPSLHADSLQANLDELRQPGSVTAPAQVVDLTQELRPHAHSSRQPQQHYGQQPLLVKQEEQVAAAGPAPTADAPTAQASGGGFTLSVRDPTGQTQGVESSQAAVGSLPSLPGDSQVTLPYAAPTQGLTQIPIDDAPAAKVGARPATAPALTHGVGPSPQQHAAVKGRAPQLAVAARAVSAPVVVALHGGVSQAAACVPRPPVDGPPSAVAQAPQRPVNVSSVFAKAAAQASVLVQPKQAQHTGSGAWPAASEAAKQQQPPVTRGPENDGQAANMGLHAAEPTRLGPTAMPCKRPVGLRLQDGSCTGGSPPVKRECNGLAVSTGAAMHVMSTNRAL